MTLTLAILGWLAAGLIYLNARSSHRDVVAYLNEADRPQPLSTLKDRAQVRAECNHATLEWIRSLRDDDPVAVDDDEVPW